MTSLSGHERSAAVILSGAKDLQPVWRTPAHYLRRPTTVSTRLSRNKTTIPSVRYYTTKRVQGGMRFTCVRCEHSVSTLDFYTRDGNLRTQAATALNQHASKAHNQPLMYSSLDPQQRIWRA